MLSLILVALVAVFLFAFFKAQPPKLFPPGPLQLPLVGSLLNGPIIGSNAQYAWSLRGKYGPILGFRNGPFSCVITQDPEITTELFVKNSSKVNGRPKDVYFDVFGGRTDQNPHSTGIVMATGDRWKENRKFAVMKVFGKDKLSSLQGKMQDEIHDWINWIDFSLLGSSDSVCIRPHQTIGHLTLNIIGSVTCDLRPSTAYASSFAPAPPPLVAQISTNIHQVLRILSTDVFQMQLVRILPALGSVKAMGFSDWKKLTIDTRSMLKSLIGEREIEVQQSGLPEKPTILDLLVSSRLQDPEFAAIESEDIVGMLMDMFAAGTDTTSVTLSWLLPQLVNNPNVQQRLFDEINSVVGRDRQCQMSDFNEMPYLDAVLNETLRRHPPAVVGLPSLVEEKIQLCDGKFEIPAGTYALMNIWGMHHDPKFWSSPMEWNPQRWIDTPELRKCPAFIPFRVGARSCLGRFLAIAEAKSILVAILQRFELRSPHSDGRPIQLVENDHVILNKPQDDCLVRFVRRAV